MIGRLGLVAGLLGALVAAGGGTAVAAPCTWTASTLPSRPGENFSGVTGTDGGNRFVGWGYGGTSVLHGLLWDAAGVTDLGAPFGGLGSSAVDVNRSGDVVGSAGDASRSGADRAWLRHGGRTAALAEPRGTVESTVAGITDTGLVAGTTYDRAGRGTGVLWHGTRIVATVRPAGASVVFTGIANSGLVSGNITRAGVAAPISWTRTRGVHRLPYAGTGHDPATTDAAGRLVVGWSTSSPELAEHPLLCVHGALHRLAGTGRPAAVNAGGRVVGTIYDTLDEQAVLWPTPTSAPVVLPGTYAQAWAVTDDGRAAGISFNGVAELPTVWACA